MKLIKIEKDDCNPCNFVEAHLRDKAVDFTAYNVQSINHEEADKAHGYLNELGLFTVPVVVLTDDNGQVVDYSNGFNPEKIDSLISQM